MIHGHVAWIADPVENQSLADRRSELLDRLAA